MDELKRADVAERHQQKQQYKRIKFISKSNIDPSLLNSYEPVDNIYSFLDYSTYDFYKDGLSTYTPCKQLDYPIISIRSYYSTSSSSSTKKKILRRIHTSTDILFPFQSSPLIKECGTIDHYCMLNIQVK